MSHEVIQNDRYSVQIADTADYFLHRRVGREDYFQYILPCGQKPNVSSGEVLGPFSKRKVIEFMLQQEKKKRGVILS